MVYADPAERRKRAGVLVHKLASDIAETWDQRAMRTGGAADPVILLIFGGADEYDDDDPGTALVKVLSAARIAEKIRHFAPGLAAHLQHLDTSELRIVVSMKHEVLLLGNDPLCQACRRLSLPN